MAELAGATRKDAAVSYQRANGSQRGRAESTGIAMRLPRCLLQG